MIQGFTYQEHLQRETPFPTMGSFQDGLDLLNASPAPQCGVPSGFSAVLVSGSSPAAVSACKTHWTDCSHPDEQEAVRSEKHFQSFFGVGGWGVRDGGGFCIDFCLIDFFLKCQNQNVIWLKLTISWKADQQEKYQENCKSILYAFFQY